MILVWIITIIGYITFNLFTTLLLWDDLDTTFQRVFYIMFGLPVSILAVCASVVYMVVKAFRREQ